jgi:hypothetical protein
VFAGVYRASGGIPRKINLIMDRLLLHGFLEELHRLDGTALATVLDEIQEEMSGVPTTLEPTPVPQNVDLRGATATSEHETELAALELKRNNILMELMREEVRLKEMLHDTPAPTPAADNAVVADTNAWQQRSTAEGK